MTSYRVYGRARNQIRKPGSLLAACLAAVLLVASGCADADSSSDGNQPVDEVTYVTGLGRYGQEGYVDLAMEKGFFAEAGIKVTIQEGFAFQKTAGLLASGKAQFAAADFTAAMIEWAKGQRDWKAVAAIHQQTVACISTWAGSGITSARELPGKKVGYIAAGVNFSLWPAFAETIRIDPSTKTWVPIAPNNLPSALAAGVAHAPGGVDAVTYYVSSVGALKAATKRDIVSFPYSDVMPDLFGNVLIAAGSLTKDNPDLVRRFAAAYVKGLRYSLEHPQEAAQAFLKHVPKYPGTVDSVASEIGTISLYATAGGQPIGALDAAKVQRAIALLQTQGLLPVAGPNLFPDTFVDYKLVPQS